MTEGDKKVKHDNFEAMIGDKYYESLYDAVTAVEANDTTITLLKDNIEVNPLIRLPINFSISLVSYYSSASLTCNFDIAPSGIMYIPETITYKGTARLLLGTIMEKRGVGDNAKSGNTEEEVYNSGSLVFTHRDTRPDNITVGYVNSFYDSAPMMPAVGAKQVVNTAVVTLPVNHYAFGTVRFTKDFNEIKGLTEYGQTVNGLTITNAIEGKDANIGESAFTIAWDLKVPIDIIEDTHYYNFVPKGLFFDLTIGDGIKVIKNRAFNSRIDAHIDHSIAEYLDLVFSHLLTITLGDSVEEICYRAFYDSLSLKSVAGGKSLKTIGDQAFSRSTELVTADFTNSPLNHIGSNAFSECKSLSRLGLPTGYWQYGGTTYFPYDMTPESLAFMVSRTNAGNTWNRTESGRDKFFYTRSLSKDSLGRFNDVAPSTLQTTLDEVIRDCAEGGEIYVMPQAEIDTAQLNRIDKSFALTIDPSIKDFTITSTDNKLNISEDKWLKVTNAKVASSIYLETDDVEGYVYSNTGGFAIREEYGVEPDTYDVNFVNDDVVGSELKAVNNKLVHNQRNYLAYGLFDFYVNADGVTHIKEESALATAGSEMEITSQVATSNKVVLIGSLTSATKPILKNVVLDKEVMSIGNFFANSDVLQNVTLGEGITEISNGAFENCTLLSSIVIPSHITSIGNGAFSGCTGLTNLDLPRALTSIGQLAFRGCSKLGSVVLPGDNELEYIGMGAFEGCTNLEAFHFSSNINNWSVKYLETTEGLDPNDLSDEAKAAEFLKTTYVAYEWIRS